MSMSTLTLSISLLYSLLYYIFISIILSILFCRIYKFIYHLSYPIKTIGFLHPFCNGGGGGERVLWLCVDLLRKYKEYEVVIYSGEKEEKEKILENTKIKFDFNIDASNLYIISLKLTFLTFAKYYPVFTLLFQSLASIILVFEALLYNPCNIFIDTTGFQFTYIIAKIWFGSKVIAYIHYPTISTDMLTLVKDQKESFNNREIVAKSKFLSNFKIIYYNIFAYLYGCMGYFADIIMVNSTWTYGHISSLMNCDNKTKVVFPSCNTKTLLPLMNDKRELVFLSVSQFRPEKNHTLQIKSFAKFMKSEIVIKSSLVPKLVLVGGCRNNGDFERVAELKRLASELNVTVDFVINAPSDELLNLYRTSLVGLHTMWNEHFGISCIEAMAAGLILVANNSGGPKLDIVSEDSGFLACTEDEYVSCFENILKLYISDQPKLAAIRKAAKERSKKFSDEIFKKEFDDSIKDILN